MNLDTALQIVESARRAADEIGIAMAIAVVDAGEHPVVMLRMDGALPRSGRYGARQGTHGYSVRLSDRRRNGGSQDQPDGVRLIPDRGS